MVGRFALSLLILAAISCSPGKREAEEAQPRASRPLEPPAKREAAERGPTAARVSKPPTGPVSKVWSEGAEGYFHLPIDPRHPALKLTPQWLDAYWVDDAMACRGSDSGIVFRADGTYSDHGEGGRYRLSANRITMVTTEIYDTGSPDMNIGAREVSDLRLIGPNEIEPAGWRDEKQRQVRLYRCPPQPTDQ